ncbi:MAG: hypothetical protein AB7P21_30130 [Lautropia sp.]
MRTPTDSHLAAAAIVIAALITPAAAQNMSPPGFTAKNPMTPEQCAKAKEENITRMEKEGVKNARAKANAQDDGLCGLGVQAARDYQEQQRIGREKYESTFSPEERAARAKRRAEAEAQLKAMREESARRAAQSSSK